MQQKTTIPSENTDGSEEFGMSKVGEPAKFKEAKVKEVEGLNNVVSIE